MVLKVSIPIMIQNAITNFVSLLDNLMVGQLGTEEMSGVAVFNQINNVFAITVFGLVSAASLFGTQFFGKGDHEGHKNTFRFRLIAGVILSIMAVLLFYFKGSDLINLFLTDDGTSNLVLTHASGMKYLYVILIGILPFTISQVYASTLRETGETFVPMIAGLTAVFVNLILNYILIFGHFNAPKLGVVGAAIATDISRFVELGILIVFTHKNTDKFIFAKGAYLSAGIPRDLLKQIIIKGAPLLLNEFLWSLGMAILSQRYSTRGLVAVAALNISSVVVNLFNVVFIALGSSIGIVVGQLLGAGKEEEAVDTDRKMICFSVVVCFFIGAIMYVFAPKFPQLYNTIDEVKQIATSFIRISSIVMPLNSFYHAAYFTMRTGGKTVITFFFDSVLMLCVTAFGAYLITKYTALTVIPVYICVQLLELPKMIIGFILLKKRVWVNNLVEEL